MMEPEKPRTQLPFRELVMEQKPGRLGGFMLLQKAGGRQRQRRPRGA